MRELIGKHDIWTLPNSVSGVSKHAICITTNGIVKQGGLAVMGAGIAKQAANRFKQLPRKLGSYLKQYGNRTFNMGVCKDGNRCYNLITLPTKNDWRGKSDIDLIIKSCKELVEVCNKFGITECYLTPPGCGCGGLNYQQDVRPVISEILDDRFIVVLSN